MMEILAGDFSAFLIRMLLASLLGALIGLERDIHGRAAGLRTHLLVSLGAAVFTILSQVIARNSSGAGFSSDPGRIAAQIVTGVGFLGAGVIIKEGFHIRGLTTAACMWVAAAIGTACGYGYFPTAIAATIIALAGLVIVKFMERLYPKDTYRFLRIKTPLETEISPIIELLKKRNVKLLNCDIKKNYQTKITEVRFSLRFSNRGIADKLAHNVIESLEKSPADIIEIKWGHA